MNEEWLPIEGFDYSVSNLGRVRNDHTGRILRPNSRPAVLLRRDGRTYCKYLPRMVAEAWVPKEPPYFFDTPMQLDANKLNCRADNFVWRTRWFVEKYTRERRDPVYPRWKAPIICVETGQVFRTPDDACRVYGILEEYIERGIREGKSVFPVGLHFDFI